jgi:aminoglycoside phosphotransferase (APT) family kinase protein
MSGSAISSGASVIGEVLAEREWEAQLEREVFATAEPAAIAEAVDGFCRSHLGAGAAHYEFFATSVGSVHGVGLSDGRRVVIKVHRADADGDHLVAVQRVQAHLGAAHFPCPRPVLGPTPLAHGLAVVETLLDEGTWADAHEPAVRGEMASTLARLIELCRPLGAPAGLGSIRDGARRLWLQPHDRRFDFAGTSHGAEWIDRLRDAANQQLDRLGPAQAVIGHSDFRAEHLRFADGRVSAVYDWDSLGVGPEPVVVGNAAHAFTADWSRRGWQLPTLTESFAFISDYEAARGTPFGREERQAASAAMIAALSYSARCEHSDRLTRFGTQPPGPAPAAVPPGGFLAHLASRGAALLGVADQSPPIAAP